MPRGDLNEINCLSLVIASQRTGAKSPPDDRLREAIQILKSENWIASSQVLLAMTSPGLAWATKNLTAAACILMDALFRGLRAFEVMLLTHNKRAIYRKGVTAMQTSRKLGCRFYVTVSPFAAEFVTVSP